MTVTFTVSGACPVCGCRNDGIQLSKVQVNKHSLRTVGTTFWFFPGDCAECGHPLAGGLFTRLTLDPGDQAKVDAYRQRKGWAA